MQADILSFSWSADSRQLNVKICTSEIEQPESQALLTYNTVSATHTATVQDINMYASVSSHGDLVAISAGVAQPTSHIRSIFSSQGGVCHLGSQPVQYAWHPAAEHILAIAACIADCWVLFVPCADATPCAHGPWYLESAPTAAMCWSPDGRYISMQLQRALGTYVSIHDTLIPSAGPAGSSVERGPPAKPLLLANSHSGIGFSPDSTRYSMQILGCHVR